MTDREKVRLLRDALEQIAGNSALVLSSQPGQERKTLEEIVYISNRYLGITEDRPES